MTKNGARRWYPLGIIDLAQIITDGKASTFNVPDYGGDPEIINHTGYRIDRTDGGAAYLTDTITDPRNEYQFVYFSGDTISECYEEIILSSEPEDFFITKGFDEPPTPHNYNTMYYTGTQYSGNVRKTYALPQNAFSAGTYYKNTSMQGVYFTDTGYSFGACFNNTFSPAIGVNIWEGFTNLSWYCHNSGLNLDWFYAPQYGLQNPKVCGVDATFISWNENAPSGDNPATPTNWISQFVTGEYNGEIYVGFIIFKIDENGNPLNSGKFAGFLFPLWYFGEISPEPEPPEPVIPEPQDYGADSWADGGGGTLSDTNTPPVISPDEQLIGGGLQQAYGVHIYRISHDKFDNLMNALYGTGSDWNTIWARWQNYKFSPISGIISSHYIPYNLCYASISTANIRMCGVAIQNTESMQMDSVQIHTTTIGSIDIPEFFGNAFDYSPYTKMSLYLPFCGWLEIDPDRVTGGGLTVSYKTDCATGDCCAYVVCKDRTGNNTYMYTKTGNCAVSFPIAGNDQGTGAVIGGLMSAAAGAVTGNVLGVAGGLVGALTGKHTQQTAGNVGGSSSLISDHQCRLQIIRPVLSIPKYGQLLRGRPSDVGIEILQLVGTGWNSFSAVHADIDGATHDECREIETLLQNGVIL